MRIQYNQGKFVQNQYSRINTDLNKTLQKLSSGYQINQAADDAAGLAISEKLKTQIRGLEQASENIQDGINLIQTAESGLGQIQNPNLVRLRELAIQASNDTLTDDDRTALQKEVTQILNGINDIANNTEFNTIHPLKQETISGYFEIENANNYTANKYLSLNVSPNGSFDLRTNKGYPGSNVDDNQELIYGTGQGSYTNPSLLFNNGQSAKLKENMTLVQPTTLLNGTYTTIYTNNSINVTQRVRLMEDKYEFKYEIKNISPIEQSAGFYFHMDTMLGNDDRAPYRVNDTPLSLATIYSNGNVPNTFDVFNANQPSIKAMGVLTGSEIIKPPDELRIGQYRTIQNPEWTPTTNEQIGDSGYALKWDEQSLQPGQSFTVNTLYGLAVPPGVTESVWTPSTVDPNYLILQVGPNEGQQFKVVLTDARTEALGINELDMSTRSSAEQSLRLIDKASNYISDERSKYGSYQNALEHIFNNVATATENLTKAESTLRDADMAKEAANMQKNQVLLQSSQSMMAQINQMSQGTSVA